VLECRLLTQMHAAARLRRNVQQAKLPMSADERPPAEFCAGEQVERDKVHNYSLRPYLPQKRYGPAAQ